VIGGLGAAEELTRGFVAQTADGRTDRRVLVLVAPGAASHLGQRDDAAPEDLMAELSRRVKSLHPGLQWEVDLGAQAARRLTVTAAGQPELRPLAERWLRAAPPPDTDWEFTAARLRDTDAMDGHLDIAEVRFGLTAMRVALHVHEERRLIDVELQHDGFGSLDESASMQVAFLVLDWLLGEDDVVRWVGEIRTSVTGTADALPVSALPETVDALAARHVEPTWVLMQGRTAEGAALVVLAQRPLRWIDHSTLDLHLAVVASYADERGDGLPTGPVLADLQAAEGELEALIDGRGLLVASETSAGRRTAHVYVDSDDDDAAAVVENWARSRTTTVVHREPDPGWRAVSRFR
jgi:hypothetical protein